MADKFKEIAKNGWHPEKSSSSSKSGSSSVTGLGVRGKMVCDLSSSVSYELYIRTSAYYLT